jgi:hypothetical protein
VSGEIGFHAEPRRKKANVQRRQVLDLGDVRERCARLEEGVTHLKEGQTAVGCKVDALTAQVAALATSHEVAERVAGKQARKWVGIGTLISTVLVGLAKAAGAL